MRLEASGPGLQAGAPLGPAAHHAGHPVSPTFDQVSFVSGFQVEKSLTPPFSTRQGLKSTCLFFSFLFFSNYRESHFLRLADHHVIPFFFYSFANIYRVLSWAPGILPGIGDIAGYHSPCPHTVYSLWGKGNRGAEKHNTGKKGNAERSEKRGGAQNPAWGSQEVFQEEVTCKLRPEVKRGR